MKKSKLTNLVGKQTTATKKAKIKLTNMDYIFLCENGTSRLFIKIEMMNAFKHLLKRK